MNAGAVLDNRNFLFECIKGYGDLVFCTVSKGGIAA